MKKLLIIVSLIAFISCSSDRKHQRNHLNSLDTNLISINAQHQDTIIVPSPIIKDFEEIKKDGVLRVITQYSQTSYFLYRGREMGFEYELMKRVADSFGLKLKIIIAKDMTDYIYKLNNGEADIAAHALTITKNRKELALFTDYLMLVKQVLVQKKPENWRDISEQATEKQLARNCVDLIGQPIHIRKYTSYNQRLLNIQNELGETFDINYVDEDISTYNLISQVNEGKIKYTIADENIAMACKAYMSNIDIKTGLSCSQRIAWAVRKNAPQLKEKIDEEIKKLKALPDFNIIFNRYFKNNKEIKDRINSDRFVVTEGGNLSRYDDIIKKESKRYGYDWRLIAAQIYQESRFENVATSWAGAQGLMQIMPNTARDLGIKNSFDPKENVNGGVRYLSYLHKYWLDYIPDTTEALKFALASYNCGKGHVIDARAIADKFGKDPKIWFDETDRALLLLSDEKYYTMNFIKYGFCRGYEPVNYVEEIFYRYDRYKRFVQ